MKKAFSIVPALLVAGCQGADTPNDPAVCERLAGEIVEAQKDASASLAGYLTSENLPDLLESYEDGSFEREMVASSLRATAPARESAFFAKATFIVELMAANGCQVPTEIPEVAPYTVAAMECNRARSAPEHLERVREGRAEAPAQCDRSAWTVNDDGETE